MTDPDMRGVVPPGGEQPVDDVPWTSATVEAAPARRDLPDVPGDVPAGTTAPADWRTITDADRDVAPPPGYVTGNAPGPYSRPQVDRWGIVSVMLGVVGILQLAVVYFPLLSAFTISVALTGRRYGELDPHGVRARQTSTIGLVLGFIGVAGGLLLWLRYRTWTSIVDL